MSRERGKSFRKESQNQVLFFFLGTLKYVECNPLSFFTGKLFYSDRNAFSSFQYSCLVIIIHYYIVSVFPLLIPLVYRTSQYKYVILVKSEVYSCIKIKIR